MILSLELLPIIIIMALMYCKFLMLFKRTEISLTDSLGRESWQQSGGVSYQLPTVQDALPNTPIVSFTMNIVIKLFIICSHVIPSCLYTMRERMRLVDGSWRVPTRRQKLER